MPHEYTRQRQGRDFSLKNYLANKTTANRNDAENVKTADEAKQTLAYRIEHFKNEAERNAVPTDGHEPIEKRGIHSDI